MIAVSNKSIIFSSFLFLSIGSGSSFRPCPSCPEPGFENTTTAFEPTPDFPEACANNSNVCDDAECDGFAEDIQATGVGFYRYVDTDADGNRKGIQYYLCACMSNSSYDFRARRRIPSVGATIWAKSICKINQVEIPLPRDSNESCSDLNIYGMLDRPLNESASLKFTNSEEERNTSGYDCNIHCNDVIFGGLGGILALPEGEFGLAGISSSSSSDYVCRCKWDNVTIEGCITPDDYGSSGDYSSSGDYGSSGDYNSSGNYSSSSPFYGRKFGLLASLAIAILALGI